MKKKKKKECIWLRYETDFGSLATHPSIKAYIEALNRQLIGADVRTRKYALAKLWQLQSAIGAIHEVAFGVGIPYEQCFKEIK